MRIKQTEEEIFKCKRAYHKKQANAGIRKKMETLVDLQRLHIEFFRKRGEKIETWKKVWEV